MTDLVEASPTGIPLTDLREAWLADQEQSQGYLSRALMTGQAAVSHIGNNLSSIVDRTVYAFQSKTARAAAIGVAALGAASGPAIASSPNTATARKANCVQFDPNAVTVDYVDQAILPLANEVVRVYRHAPSRDIRRRNNTSEMYGNTYSHVTEISVRMPRRLANGQPGIFSYIADFKGKILPEDMIAFDVAPIIGSSNQSTSKFVYDFEFVKTKGSVLGSRLGLHWLMGFTYTKKGNPYDGFVAASKLTNDFELKNYDSMNPLILSKGIDQAKDALVQAERHQLIRQPKDLVGSAQLTRVCA